MAVMNTSFKKGMVCAFRTLISSAGSFAKEKLDLKYINKLDVYVKVMYLLSGDPQPRGGALLNCCPH